MATRRTVCWKPTWSAHLPGIGLEHLVLDDGIADGVVLAIDDEQGPFRLGYRLEWDGSWRLRRAHLAVKSGRGDDRSLDLKTDGHGRWCDASGQVIDALDGCIDVDIWPTPFTNTFPIRREPIALGERREFRMAWVSAPALTVEPKPQAYTRLADRRYRFESLDGSGFSVELPVDDDGIVVDYPGLFIRVP